MFSYTFMQNALIISICIAFSAHASDFSWC